MENKSEQQYSHFRRWILYFEFLVQVAIDSSWSDWLEGLEVQLLENGEMILSGYLPDQAALMGVLNKLNRLEPGFLCSVNQRIDNKFWKKINTNKLLNRTFETIAWGLYPFGGPTRAHTFLACRGRTGSASV